MKLLFDQNLSYRLVDALATEFPDSTQVRLVKLDTASDEEIWHYAARNGFAIVTKDEDFANRVALLGHPPQVIWLRIGNTGYSESLAILRRHTTAIRRFLSEGSAGCLELFP